MLDRLRMSLAAWNDLALFFTLIGASMKGQAGIVCKMLDSGVDVNTTKNNTSPLLAAVKHAGHTETVMLLLNRGANIHAKDKNGKTAFAIASDKGRTDLMALLETADDK